MADSPIVIDPATGERVQSAPVQIDPQTGERVSPPSSQPSAQPEGFWHSLGAQFGLTPEAAEAMRQHVLQHPVEAGLEALGGPAWQVAKGASQGFMRSTGEAGQAVDAARAGNMPSAVVHAVTALPFVGQAIDKGSDQFNAGNYAGAAGTGLGATLQAAPMVAGAVDSAFPGRATVPNPMAAPLKRMVTGDVNAPIAGTDLTPAQRYASLKNMGVVPSAAEATNSPALKAAESVNENSLTSSHLYENARRQNLDALDRYTQEVLNDISPRGPQEGGAALQQALLKAHGDLKAAATDAYKDLDAQVGDQPIYGAAGLREQAQTILDENAPYYKLHPELEPTKAMAIVRDLAGAKAPARPGPAVIPGFGPAPVAAEVAPTRVPTYSELHRLRSDLLDFNNTNPDLVKNQSNGWISQLAGAADKAITSGEGGLNPEQFGTFRNANDAWKFMKDTFDNPSHPFYQAVRTPSPSTLVNGTSGIARTLENVDLLHTMLGPEGIGPVQRGVAERLLGTTKEGNYNFKNFQGMWNKLPEDYREKLFTSEQQRQLGDIGNAGTVLNTDLNPSGSAKQGQKMAEMGTAGAALAHPPAIPAAAAYHAGQYVLGKLMNSPTFVDWLMREQGAAAAPRPATPLIPAAAASTAVQPKAEVDPHTGPLGQPNYYSDEYLRGKAAFDAARQNQ